MSAQRLAEQTAAAGSAGLTSAEVARRLCADGPNEVPSAPPTPLLTRVGRQLADPLILLLLAAAVVTSVLADYPDTMVIALVVVVNTAIGVVQEVRADRAVAALNRLAAPTARVVRDEAEQVIAAAGLVRGDLVSMQAGDVVPADLQLVTAVQLTIDEAAVTGESVPVGRGGGDEASAGTVVVAGRAAGVVTRTGADSSLGRITTLVAATRPGPTPLQRRLAGLGRILGLAAVVLSAVVFGIGMLTGVDVFEMAIVAVSLVVAAVPESLPAVVTLALALGARRMARAHAIPRRLQAVETLGSVTVIASDKTGTLTEGRMTVQRAVAAGDAEFAVTGNGYAPTGAVTQRGTEVAAPPDLVDLARAALLCNDASLAAPDHDRAEWAVLGDPFEGALVAFAARCGLDPQTERATWPRVAEQPFDQDARRMTTVHRGPDGGYLLVCKGAPESVLPLLRPDAGRTMRDAADAQAGAGLRVLAVATAYGDRPVDPGAPAGLVPVGVIGVGDPLRVGAADTAATFAASGIRLILITGDHPATAAAIGDQLGILHADDEVARGDTAAVTEDADRVRVWARTRPERKLDIVKALQDSGHIVAMTGDGVNDAPALRRADIGVAMGGGTEVARQAADLILVDDNLATVGVAVREGRRIYDNIRRFLRYALSGGLAEILVMLVGPSLGLGIPLLPAQILWINLLTHGVPGVALGAEPAEPGVMKRRPRPPGQSVLGAGLVGAIAAGGAGIAAVTLAAGLFAHQTGRPWQTVVFLVLGLAQLGLALAVRGRRASGERANHWLPAAVALSALLQLAGVFLPPLRELLGTDPLAARDVLLSFAAAALPGLAVWAVGRGRRDHERVAGVAK